MVAEKGHPQDIVRRTVQCFEAMRGREAAHALIRTADDEDSGDPEDLLRGWLDRFFRLSRMAATPSALTTACCSTPPRSTRCMVKKQQMRWSESGAHNLLQVRTKVLNDQLRETFVRWYPGMQTEQDTKSERKAA
jgi:hypothetical protein